MKFKIGIWVVLAFSSTSLSGFTLDFTGLSTNRIDPGDSFLVDIPGYGDVELSVPLNRPAVEFGNVFSEHLLELAVEQGEVIISFDNGPVSEVTFVTSVSQGISFSEEEVSPTEVSLRSNFFGGQRPAVGVGVRSLTFATAPTPEPSSALLVSITLGLALFRRRRGSFSN